MKLFSGELRAAFRQTDMVGRWGGDEFVVVVDGGEREAQVGVERIGRWVNGEYSVSSDPNQKKVLVKAAVGLATWRPGDSVADLLQRADTAMYAQKLQKTHC